MKKLFSFVALCLLILSCSSDDSSASGIRIDGKNFVPKIVDGSPVATRFVPGNTEGLKNRRTFYLIKASTPNRVEEQLSFSVDYPYEQTSIDGTYFFDYDENPILTADGFYYDELDEYYFNTGSVSIKDLGSSRYRLTFSNVVGASLDSSFYTTTVTGTYEAVFDVVE